MRAIYLEENETFIEVKIVLDKQEIGRAEIKANNNELCYFQIFEPFQNKGYGQEALKLLIEQYRIKTLNVRYDDERAKHIYKKFGFKMDKTSYYEMRIDYPDNRFEVVEEEVEE